VVLNVAVTLQEGGTVCVAHVGALKVGAANNAPVGDIVGETSAENAILSIAHPKPPQPVPTGKPFSAVAVIVRLGLAPPLVAVTLEAVVVMATHGGLTELLKVPP
jgi:hypothetical protein